VWERARSFHRGDQPPKVRRLMAQPLGMIDAGPTDDRDKTQATPVTDPAVPSAH
jgi:hypothetical protein